MLRFIFQFFFILIFFVTSTISEEFDKIIINGNERISNETILVFSELSNENFLDENSINIILKKLYKTNFFKDVSINIENNNLIINVIENPIIQTVSIEGVKQKSVMNSLFDTLSLKNRSSFNLSTVKQDEKSILENLKSRGYYFSKVITSINELSDNKIDLTYRIELGKKAKISKVDYVFIES